MIEEKSGVEVFSAGYKGAERRFVQRIMREGEERRRAAPPAKEGEVDWVNAEVPGKKAVESDLHGLHRKMAELEARIGGEGR